MKTKSKTAGTKINFTHISGTGADFGGGRREKPDVREKSGRRGLTGYQRRERAATEER